MEPLAGLIRLTRCGVYIAPPARSHCVLSPSAIPGREVQGLGCRVRVFLFNVLLFRLAKFREAGVHWRGGYVAFSIPKKAHPQKANEPRMGLQLRARYLRLL